MSRLRIIRADYRYLLFTEVYHRRREIRKANGKLLYSLRLRSNATREADFRNPSRSKWSRGRPASHARFCDTIFKNAEDLRGVSVKYIRLLFQKLAVDAMIKEPTAERMLRAYVYSCFSWVENFRTHSLVWLSFLH